MSVITFFPSGTTTSEFDPSLITYSGEYDYEETTMDGKDYYLWTLKTSGTLTVNSAAVLGDLCLCGGGSGGDSGIGTVYSGNGGNGGFVNNYYDQVIFTSDVIIGAGGSSSAKGGTTEYSALLLRADGGTYPGEAANGKPVGGSGGGLSPHHAANTARGQGTTTRPFGLLDRLPFSAGGGAGSCWSIITGAESSVMGGNGGTDGGNGGNPVGDSNYLTIGGAGGEYGGGTGGGATSNMTGTDATYYGAGGGGGGFQCLSEGGSLHGYGGNGYSGVVMLRIKKST